MATESFSDTLMKAGVYHDIEWADKVAVTLPGNYLPFPHQYEGINLTCSYDRSALFDEAGTGKTLSIQANALYRVGCGNKVVVLTTPTLLSQFYEDMYETFVGFEKYATMEIFRGTSAQRAKLVERYNLEGWPDILLMTYDLFRGNKPKLKTSNGKKQRINVNTIGYHQILKQNGYSVLICDEGHCLRNTTSNIHRRVFSWIGGKNVEAQEAALVISTATPSHTHLEQCYGLIRLKSPSAYSNKAEFERLHIQYNPYTKFQQIDGYLNLDLMTMNLYSQARRVEKRDVAKDMPERLVRVVPVHLDPAHKKLYKKLLNERTLELQDKFIDALQDSALRQAALQLCSIPNKYSDTKIINRMEDTLMELLTEIDLRLTKVIVFIHFNEVADHLMMLLAKYNPALLNGRVNDKDTPKRAFLKDPKCRILIAHPKSAGAGLNLQSVCSNVIYYECPESPGDVAQSIDRVHRIVGTTETVNVQFLAPKGTWAEKKIKQVVGKDENINKVVGDRKALLSDLCI